MTTSAKSIPAAPESKPLAGRRILITRAPHQASELADRLRELGAIPVLVPTIEIVAPRLPLRRSTTRCQSVGAFDLVVFTSANAVEALHKRAELLGLTPRPRRIAVVGTATARALEAIGLKADVMPATFTAEALGRDVAPEAPGRRVLLLLAEDAPTVLRDALVAAGAEVTVAAAYRNRIPEASLAAVGSLFAAPGNYPDAVTFTSASTAVNLVALLECGGAGAADGGGAGFDWANHVARAARIGAAA